jgi:hypothetical protein
MDRALQGCCIGGSKPEDLHDAARSKKPLVARYPSDFTALKLRQKQLMRAVSATPSNWSVKVRPRLTPA